MCFRKAVLVFLFGVMWPGLPRPLLLAQVEAPQYVGSDACQACHEEIAGKIAETAHSKLAQEQEPRRQGCEACHGPGSNHINSGGDKSLLFSFRGASRVAVARQCGVCHQGESDSNSIHNHRTTSCLACHAVHHYRQKNFLLVETQPQLCANCHDRLPEALHRD